VSLYPCAETNIILKNNKAQIAKRIPHTYTVGNKVLIKRGTENKYKKPYQGLLLIKNVEDTINIRWLTPFLDTDNIPHGGECRMRNSRVRRANQA
jgi:hypothetical protein